MLQSTHLRFPSSSSPSRRESPIPSIISFLLLFIPSKANPETEEFGSILRPIREALLKGGEQVTSVLEEVITLLQDMKKMNEASENVAVESAAQGVIGKRVDQMESGFMMALDYMIQLADKKTNTIRKCLLEVVKETVLGSYPISLKSPLAHVMIGLLSRTPKKESRQELLRRVAAGGGAFESKDGNKLHLPGANLNDIANQAGDLLERGLFPEHVLIREEARNMMGGGILDERNDRGFSTLPESENVMQGKDEGADDLSNGEDSSTQGGRRQGRLNGRGRVTGRKPLPVRPGMFFETVTKVMGQHILG
ncbi:hypothetical protein F2Q69_00055993 [Brassica cretica]|uniref:Uncharacterized protein n=1 Tax=Brassica cretica TaxID=69181 RepID=A0A8S9N1W1_BRACR|nr:hypothetical protein F2Q69_00055993 [Brassica cretica]